MCHQNIEMSHRRIHIKDYFPCYCMSVVKDLIYHVHNGSFVFMEMSVKGNWSDN